MQGVILVFVAHVFVSIKEFVMENLRLGFSIFQVMVKHRRNVQQVVESSGYLTRDTFLNE
jgi:hypothetical protein